MKSATNAPRSAPLPTQTHGGGQAAAVSAAAAVSTAPPQVMCVPAESGVTTVAMQPLHHHRQVRCTNGAAPPPHGSVLFCFSLPLCKPLQHGFRPSGNCRRHVPRKACGPGLPGAVPRQQDKNGRRGRQLCERRGAVHQAAELGLQRRPPAAAHERPPLRRLVVDALVTPWPVHLRRTSSLT